MIRNLDRYFIIFFILFFVICCDRISQNEHEKKYHISIVSIVEIEPIAELRKGFVDFFMKSEFAKKNNVLIKEYNAQNDASLINQIIDKLSIEKPQLIYVLGTPIAQAIQKRLPGVLLVQGAATDPVTAGLADSWEGSGRNYVATTDLPPVSKQVDLINSLTPKVKRLGILYNPGEGVLFIKRKTPTKNGLPFKIRYLLQF